VFVITACPSGIIGDDPITVVRDIRSEFPDVPILPITTDGNIHGDYMQGVINACIEGAAALIDLSVEPEGNMVNILAEKNIANNAESNFAEISKLLGGLGITVNCRFVRDTSVDALRGFRKARLNLLAYRDHFGRLLRSYFSEHMSLAFAAHPFPVGFAETERWLSDIAAFFGKTEAVRDLVDSNREYYSEAVQRFRPILTGKRLMIASYLHDVDWIIEIALEMGMIVEKVGVFNYIQDYLFQSRFQDNLEVETGYTPDKRDADIERFLPDLLLCNYVPKKLPTPLHVDTIPLCPDVGFFGGLVFARRWAALLKSPVREGWRDDTLSSV
jgi:nitrogenase molybdenum-iron protein alpha/beta subunit